MPLNAVIRVVFSEPVELASVESGVHVRQASGPVAGTVRLLDGSPGAIDFIPDRPLAPGTNYTLDIDAGVLDLDGDPLLAAVTVPFATTTPVPPSVDLIALRGYNQPLKKSVLFLIKLAGGVVTSAGTAGDPAWSARRHTHRLRHDAGQFAVQLPPARCREYGRLRPYAIDDWLVGTGADLVAGWYADRLYQ